MRATLITIAILITTTFATPVFCEDIIPKAEAEARLKTNMVGMGPINFGWTRAEVTKARAGDSERIDKELTDNTRLVYNDEIIGAECMAVYMFDAEGKFHFGKYMMIYEPEQAAKAYDIYARLGEVLIGAYGKANSLDIVKPDDVRQPYDFGKLLRTRNCAAQFTWIFNNAKLLALIERDGDYITIRLEYADTKRYDAEMKRRDAKDKAKL